MKYELSKDDEAVLDYVSGLRESLGAAVGAPSEDRARAQELKAMAANIGAMKLAEPEMGVTFANIMAKANLPKAGSHWFDRISAGWRLRIAVAASFVMALGFGAAIAAKARWSSGGLQFNGVTQAEQVATGDARLPDAATAGGAPSFRYKSGSESVPMPAEPEMVMGESADGLRHGPLFHAGATDATGLDTLMRSGSLQLRDEEPAKIQRKISEALILAGGMITSLNRSGTGKSTTVTIELAVPSDKYAKFVLELSALAEVTGQTEQAVDAGGQLINNEAALAEAQDYLKRLDALAETGKGDLSELQRLESERRNCRRDIERLKRALEAIKDRVEMARLTVTISTTTPVHEPYVPRGAFQEAWEDGTDVLVKISAFLLTAFLGALPLLVLILLGLLVVKRVRKSRMPV